MPKPMSGSYLVIMSGYVMLGFLEHVPILHVRISHTAHLHPPLAETHSPAGLQQVCLRQKNALGPISLQVDERPSKGSEQMLLMRIRSKVELCFWTSHTWASASHLQLWQHALLSSAKLVGIDKHACYHMHCKGFLTPSRPCPQQE